jgi:hypothetical protein
MQSESPAQVKFANLITRHLQNHDNNPGQFLAAASLVYTPSTTVRYARAAKKVLPPHHAPAVKNAERYARRMMGTARGAPRQAVRFSAAQFVDLVNRTRCPRMRDTLILLFVTASRAADLPHFEPIPHPDHNPPLWRIKLIVTEDGDVFHAPKSDQTGSRQVSKWTPQHPQLNPCHSTWPTWRQINDQMKRIGCTAHSIRGSAINILENEGFTHDQIRCLTGHAPSDGTRATAVKHYSCHTPQEPEAQMSCRLSGILLSKLTLLSNPSRSLTTTVTSP